MLHKHKISPHYFVYHHKTLITLEYFEQLSEFPKKISEIQTIPTHYFMFHLLLWKQFVSSEFGHDIWISFPILCILNSYKAVRISKFDSKYDYLKASLMQHYRKYEQDIERVKKMYFWCTRCIRIWRSWWKLSVILILCVKYLKLCILVFAI